MNDKTLRAVIKEWLVEYMWFELHDTRPATIEKNIREMLSEDKISSLIESSINTALDNEAWYATRKLPKNMQTTAAKNEFLRQMKEQISPTEYVEVIGNNRL